MRSPRQFPPDPHDVLVDERGPDEWIVDVPGHERPLHVFRLGPSDWLVSEVGRPTEGRGRAVSRALAALSAGAAPVIWGRLVADALDSDGESQ